MRVGGKTPSSQCGHILTNVFQCECQLKVVFFFIIADHNITILVQQGTAIKKNADLSKVSSNVSTGI